MLAGRTTKAIAAAARAGASHWAFSVSSSPFPSSLLSSRTYATTAGARLRFPSRMTTTIDFSRRVIGGGGGSVSSFSSFSASSSSVHASSSLRTPFSLWKAEKSTAATAEEDDPSSSFDEGEPSPSRAAGGEAWTANLGRNPQDESWLTGPRTENWYTGRSPKDCPGVDDEGYLRSLPLPNLNQVTRKSAQEYFDNTWTLFETLFAGLQGEEPFYRPPVHGLRHPQIFYYGHGPCLYVNKLRVAGLLDKPVNAHFESIFEVGVDEMLWDDMHKNDMIWPTVPEVHEYRKEVYQAVSEMIATHPSLNDEGATKVDWDHPMWALFMSFEHERIHLETSSVLFRETPVELVRTPEGWPPLHPSAKRGRREEGKKKDPIAGADYPTNPLLPGAVTPTTVTLGKPRSFPSFGWDNEYGSRAIAVPPFEASECMVSNGEYYEFVKDGGYRTKDYWCDDGWEWRKHRNLKWPFFWCQAGPAGSHEYDLRTIFEVIPMQWDWPVDVTYYESKAFCRWKTAKEGSSSSSSATTPYRVLTEAEHHVLRDPAQNLAAARSDVSSDRVMNASGGPDFAEGPAGANLNLTYSSHNPVDHFPPTPPSFSSGGRKRGGGHRDVRGNAWEWTEDHFNPLNDFRIHPYYDDFSTPCFDGKHSMIVGGSFVSTGDEASVFARFHFRPHFLQHSGFRLVRGTGEVPATKLGEAFEGQAAQARASAENAAEEPASEREDDAVQSSGNSYETEELLNMYLGLHYPSSGMNEGMPPMIEHENAPVHGLHFPQRVANLLTKLVDLDGKGSTGGRRIRKALDVGCAVGGSSFELAKSFDVVDAFDYSESFVSAAKRMQTSPDDVRFRIPTEGDSYEEVRAIHEPHVAPELLAKPNFFVGDATRINEYVESGMLDPYSYDAVLMLNLLCRLPDPEKCLDEISKVVADGGVVLLVSPYSWMEEYTPKSKWLGGYDDPISNEPFRSKDRLNEIMARNGFERIHEEEMACVIREHRRKYQYVVSEATGWRKAKK